MDIKHEKVLHTRVSKDLYEEISSKAKKHRVTVSNLIRNLVEDYLEIQNDVLDAVDQKVKTHLDKDKDVLGYQPINLAKNAACEVCGKIIKQNEEAFLGFFQNSSRKILTCKKCHG